MNSMLFVDQSAACIIMSAGLARSLGIPDRQVVYLHGCGDAYESQTTLYRQSLHRSEATRLAGDRAMTQAGIKPDQIDLVDLYTCFPIAAQAAAREFGLDSTHGGKMKTTSK